MTDGIVTETAKEEFERLICFLTAECLNSGRITYKKTYLATDCLKVVVVNFDNPDLPDEESKYRNVSEIVRGYLAILYTEILDYDFQLVVSETRDKNIPLRLDMFKPTPKYIHNEEHRH